MGFDAGNLAATCGRADFRIARWIADQPVVVTAPRLRPPGYSDSVRRSLAVLLPLVAIGGCGAESGAEAEFRSCLNQADRIAKSRGHDAAEHKTNLCKRALRRTLN